MIDRHCPRSVSGWPIGRFSNSAASSSYTMDYAKHRIPLSPVQRVILTAGAAAISFVNPFRADMIACLAETTGTDALSYCYRQMLSTPEGCRILTDKPRISSSTIDFSALKRLPTGTLGRTYYEFLHVNVSSFNDFSSPIFLVDHPSQISKQLPNYYYRCKKHGNIIQRASELERRCSFVAERVS